MRRSRCEGCKVLSEEVWLRWAGTGKGYVNLCGKCTQQFRKGRLKAVVDPEGHVKVVA